MDAQNQAWQAFHRTDLAACDMKASPQYQSAPTDNLSRPHPYYPAGKASNVSYGARLLVPSSSRMTADGRTTEYDQYARFNLHRSSSQNKPMPDHPGPFDERWLGSPEEMWNTDTTRTSPLTISPGESGSNSEEEYASSGSCSGRSSLVNTVTRPISAIAHANSSESLESWLEAVGPNAEIKTSLNLEHTTVQSVSEGYGTQGGKISTAPNEQHQAKKHHGNFAPDMSGVVLYPTNKNSEHGRADARADVAFNEENVETMVSTPRHSSEGAVAELTKEGPDHSKRVPVPYHLDPPGSTDSFLISDRKIEIDKGRAIEAVLALEELAHKYQLFDQVEIDPRSGRDTTWMSSVIEKAKRRRATSVVRKVKEKIGLDRKDDKGFCARVLGQDLPSVVVTPNIESSLIHGDLVLFEGTGATAHNTPPFETSSAGQTMGQSLLACEENQPRLDSYSEINETIEHTGSFSSQLSAAMNLANMQEQEERIKTLRILQTQLSADITIQDTFGQQQRPERPRAASGAQLYYEMTDLHGRPYILPWPPEEGSPAYKAQHKPGQLLHLEAHPKGFFISHPVECSDETVRAHYLWLSTGLSNIHSYGTPPQAHNHFDNTTSGNKIRSAARGESRERLASTQNEMQQLDSVLREFQLFVTSRSRNRSPSITQNIQQQIGPIQSKNPGDDGVDKSDAMDYEQQAVRSFVPTTTGPLVILDDGAASTETPDLNPMTNAYASQPAWCASVSAPTLAGPSALAVLNSNSPGYFESTPGSYTSSHRPAMLHYRPGIDTMFPVPMARPSSRYRRLTCCGQPNYEVATKDEFQPFCEAARLRKPAFWGVMKFTGVSTLFSYHAKSICLLRDSDIILGFLGLIVLSRPVSID